MERVGVEIAPERQPRARLTAVNGQSISNDVVIPPDQGVPDVADPFSVRANQLDAFAKHLAAQEQALNQRAAGLARVTAIHEASSKLISTRAKLMLAVIGAFVLAMYAMSWQSTPGIAVLIVWCVLAIGPLSFLEWTANRRSQL